MVVMVVAPVMSPMVVRHLRLRSHRGQQEQQQRSEKKLFHILRVTSGNDLCESPSTSKFRSGHIQ